MSSSRKPGPKSKKKSSLGRKASKRPEADLGDTNTSDETEEYLERGEETNRQNSTRVLRSVAESSRTNSIRSKINKPVTRRRKDIIDRNFFQSYKKLVARVDFMIPRSAFSRVVREIMLSFDTEVKYITQTAFEALQVATEAYVEGRLEDANLLALHARRVTLMVKDLELINFLRYNER